MKLVPNSYIELVERAGQYVDYIIPSADELLKSSGFYGLAQHSQAPIFYVVDYSKKKYLYIDPSCAKILGYNIDFLSEEGPLFYTGLWHRNDYKIFVEHIFPETLLFLKTLSSSESNEYSFSFNYRIQTCGGEYLTMLQRSTYLGIAEDGTPLAGVGFVIDISHFKEDTKIIYTIEKIDRNFTTLSKKPVYKMVYYPDKETEVLSKRELEVLQCIYEGLSSKQIAHKLFISLYTVNNHRKNMLIKTNAKSVSEVLRYALTKGLI